MKLSTILVLAAVSLLLFSCNDDDGGYVQVKNSEHLLYLAIKDYRESNIQSDAFVHQYLMVGEAQLYSYKMANGFEEVGTQGLQEHWDELDTKYSFYNYNGLVLKTEAFNEDQMLTEILLIPGADSILLDDVTQCGIGIESDTAGINYVTVLLAKAD